MKSALLFFLTRADHLGNLKFYDFDFFQFSIINILGSTLSAVSASMASSFDQFGASQRENDSPKKEFEP